MGVFAILEEQVIYLYIYIIFTPKFLPNSTFPVSISKSNWLNLHWHVEN